MTINDLCKLSHETAKEKGFWKQCSVCKGTLKHWAYEHEIDCKYCVNGLDQRNDGEMIALMHSELSEALEALRHGNGKSDHIPEFSFLEEEMADLLIRVGDYCEARGVRLEEAIKAKMEFNKTRPHKHGKLF